MISIACIKNLKEMPPAFFFSSLEDGEMATSSLTILPQGDGVMATCILPFSSLEDGEMATAILTVLPQGDGVMATSTLLFLF